MTEYYEMFDGDEVRPGRFPEQGKLGFDPVTDLIYKFTPTFILNELLASLADTTGGVCVDTGLKTMYGTGRFSVTGLGYAGARTGVSPGAFAAWPHWEVYGVMDLSKEDEAPYTAFIHIRMVITTDGKGNFNGGYFLTFA
jgi:hypothetical protein